jgi:hypothetical protein
MNSWGDAEVFACILAVRRGALTAYRMPRYDDGPFPQPVVAASRGGQYRSAEQSSSWRHGDAALTLGQPCLRSFGVKYAATAHGRKSAAARLVELNFKRQT